MFKRLNVEIVIGLLCIAPGILVLILTRSFPAGAASNMQLSGPAFFPNVLSIILIIMGLLQLGQGILRKTENAEGSVRNALKVLSRPASVTLIITILLIAFYIAAVERLGFFVTSYLFLFLLLWRLKVVWWKSLLTALIFLAVIYLIFAKVFMISLPAGILM